MPGWGRAGALEAVRAGLTELQDLLAGEGEGEARAGGGDGAFALPAWVEEAVFEEFVAGNELTLEELEAEILALETGGSGALATLRRRLHSLKGEVGVLGLDEVERVCHTVEDLLDDNAPGAELADRLLTIKDWLGEALRAYGRRERPATTADAVLAALHSAVPVAAPVAAPAAPVAVPAAPVAVPAAPVAVSAAAERPPAPPAPAARAEASGWDAETVELANEFLQESEDGLTQVDDILLGVDVDGVAIGEVDAIFRVFHTMKGVAGFLELSEITKLAHISETLLDQGRKGTLAIKGGVIDLLFDTTALLRHMLTDLREAMSRGLKPESQTDLPWLITRLEARIAGQSDEEPLPTDAPGDTVARS